MSDPNPPEQPSFNRPAGGDPTTPLPSSQPPSPAAGAGSARHPPPPRPWLRPADPAACRASPTPRREGAGFFTALFDFSFTNFVTPILVRFVYLLATVALVASWLIFVFAGFANSVGTGLAALILGPVFVDHLPRRHPHDPRVLPLGRADERGHPQATPPGLTARATPNHHVRGPPSDVPIVLAGHASSGSVRSTSEGGLLLGDAVDAAAAGEERPGVDADDPAARVGLARGRRARRRPAGRRRCRR